MRRRKFKGMLKYFDIIGDIAIIDIKEEYKSLNRRIVEEILSTNKHVKVVLEKASPISGRYRIFKVKWLGGEKRFITIYREHGCIFKVDFRKVFFTPRLSGERLRIAEKVKTGEVIINMFSGIGTYSIIIAKKSNPKIIYSIDLNPAAYELMKENIRINRVENIVIPILGDAKEIVNERLQSIADRVLMPLPALALKYLPYALKALRNGVGIIHIYDFVKVEKGEKPESKMKKLYLRRLETLNSKSKILLVKKVGEVGPRKYRMALDIKVEG